MSVAGTFSSLRNRNFRLFFIGQLISNSGNWLTNVALTLLVLHLSGSGVAVGLLAVCQYGPILVLSAWGGAVADRHRQAATLLFVTQMLEMAQSAALAVLAFMPHPPLAAPATSPPCAGGCMLAFDNPVRRSFVTEMVPPDDIPNAVVLYSANVNISRIFGPAIAGLLVVTVGYGWCFTVDAVTYLVVLLGLAMMRAAELRRAPPRPGPRGRSASRLRYIAGMPDPVDLVRQLLVIGTPRVQLQRHPPAARQPHAARQRRRVHDRLLGVQRRGRGPGLVVASRGWWRSATSSSAPSSLGVATLGLAVVPDVAAAIPMAFVVGAAGVLYFTPTTAIVQMEADPTMHGRLLALQVGVHGRHRPARRAGPRRAGRRGRLGASRSCSAGWCAWPSGVWGALAIRRTREVTRRGDTAETGTPRPVRSRVANFPSIRPTQFRATTCRASFARGIHGGCQCCRPSSPPKAATRSSSCAGVSGPSSSSRRVTALARHRRRLHPDEGRPRRRTRARRR